MPKLGPYSRTAILSKLDGRTREARLMHGTRAALIAHVGGRPTVIQQALIEQVCQLQIRIALMDRAFAASGAQTEHDSRCYLAWANSLTRILRDLGVKPTAAAAPTMTDYLAGRTAQAPVAA